MFQLPIVAQWQRCALRLGVVIKVQSVVKTKKHDPDAPGGGEGLLLPLSNTCSLGVCTGQFLQKSHH